MKKVKRTLAAALAATMLLALTACSKGDVTSEVSSGLAELKSQATEPAVEPKPETSTEAKTDPATPAADPEPAATPEAEPEPTPASAPAENPDYPSAAGLNTVTLEAFGTDYTLVLNVTCPDQGWYKPATNSFGDFKLFPTDDPSNIFSGDPRMLFELQRDLDKINYYYDDFENVEELAPRTIGGVELAGRSYKKVGMWWTEYYGEMPTGGWLSIRISGVDIEPGTEGDAVLSSVTFG
ncbi:procyclic acidic repetitive family protein [uncultured Gemmiger sp.]|uniref:procyclic acidic repetitive family protein n=1 Tax=uncultured Gemmiger sp. TaxID=1623490 RepID=UPI0025F446DE|nr:procyclic acidic repetitive family protein [uncultured Gemmiger sp.]